MPNVPDIDLTAQTLPEGVTEEDVTNFTSIYREHCEVLLDAVVTLQFSSVEIIWQQFWRSANNSEDLLDDDPEKIMPKRVLHQLCDWPPVQDYVKTMDYLFYQNLVDVLIPDVLRAIPSECRGGAALVLVKSEKMNLSWSNAALIRSKSILGSGILLMNAD